MLKALVLPFTIHAVLWCLSSLLSWHPRSFSFNATMRDWIGSPRPEDTMIVLRCWVESKGIWIHVLLLSKRGKSFISLGFGFHNFKRVLLDSVTWDIEICARDWLSPTQGWFLVSLLNPDLWLAFSWKKKTTKIPGPNIWCHLRWGEELRDLLFRKTIFFTEIFLFKVVSVAWTAREYEGFTQKCQGVVVESGQKELTGAVQWRIVTDLCAWEFHSQVFFSATTWASFSSQIQTTNAHQPL